MGHDLSGPSAAEWAIIDYDQKENSFSDQYGYELSDYFGTIIAEIGMIVEAITTLTVRLPKEDKEYLIEYAEEHDLSVSQIVRQLIRNHLFRCRIFDD